MSMNLFPQETSEEKASIPEIKDTTNDERDDPLFLTPVHTEGRMNSSDKEDDVAGSVEQNPAKQPTLIMEEFCTTGIEKGLFYFQNRNDKVIVSECQYKCQRW